MDCPYRIEGTVLDLFKQQVKLTPDFPAIVYKNESLSYRELDESSNRLARFLLLQGVSCDTPVGLCLNRTINTAVAIFAIMKTGAAYMPLDLHAPTLRLQSIINNSCCSFILSEQVLEAKIGQYQGKLISLDILFQEVDSQDSSDLDILVSLRDLIYILHTSGTTGVPKGVAVEHRTLVNLILWHKHILKDGGLKTLAFASFNFDVSAQELLSTCCTGGTLFIAPEEVRVLPDKLVDYVDEKKIERVFMPFTPLNYFIEAAQSSKKNLSDLKSVITAGEALLVNESIRAFFKKHVNCRLNNHYGPTETHVATAYEFKKPVGDWDDKPSIGKPIANVQIYILDENMLPVADGEQGEIFISGICPARGYLNQPELTQNSFLPDPFSKIENQLMYRTGDRGRFLQDGDIEFLGRVDLQVKIRGFRIELSEIEIMLMEHPGVKFAVVQVFEQEFRTKQLVAYLEPVGSSIPGIFEIRSFLAARLPDYMLPHSFVFVDKFSITENGKLDRNKLPSPDKVISDIAYAAPTDELQSDLVAIWREVLNLDKVGIADNFFILGGDSLLAARLLVEMESNFNIDLSLAELYESTTVTLLSNVLRKKIKDKKKQEELLLLQILDQVENMTDEQVNNELSDFDK